MSVSPTYQKETIEAANTFTEPVPLGPGDSASIQVTIGTSTTATVQRRYDNGVEKSEWYDVANWSADVSASIDADEHQEVRLGVKAGNYGSGTTTVRLGAG